MKFTYTHISKDYTEITKYKVNKSNKIIKINNMFKIKENDIFAKNMSQGELYQVYLKFKAKQEMDKFLNKLIAKNGTTNY